jgi:diacylglycerol kinase
MEFFSGLIESVRHAWRGFLLAFRTERSFRIQIAAGLGVVLLVIVAPFATWERVVLLLATASVLVLELFNSMVERFVDLVKPRLHGYVRDIKDLMAAAVFVASAFAVIIGLLILWPYLGTLFERV